MHVDYVSRAINRGIVKVGAIDKHGSWISIAFVKVSIIFNPAQVLSYAITSVAVTVVALCYAELAAAIPSTGAAYSYTYHYFGEFWAWIVGWSLLLE